jgi:exoribonuclease-2
MIATNEHAALSESAGVASLRWVVRSPERWLRITEVVAKVGESLPKVPDSRAPAGFLARRHKVDPVRFPDLSLAIVKLMGSGEYVAERPGEAPIGHFRPGHARLHALHRTQPPVPDLITSRLLKGVLAGTEPPYSLAELEALAQPCTEQENGAQKVERSVRKSEAAMLLESHVGQQFDAIVTGRSVNDTWVRTFAPQALARMRSEHRVIASRWFERLVELLPVNAQDVSSTSC